MHHLAELIMASLGNVLIVWNFRSELTLRPYPRKGYEIIEDNCLLKNYAVALLIWTYHVVLAIIIYSRYDWVIESVMQDNDGHELHLNW